MDTQKRIIELLGRSHSVYHAVAEMENELISNGFAYLSEAEPFVFEPGGKYYVKRNGTSIIAFKVPSIFNLGFQIAATHNDSPTFKLKPSPFVKCLQGIKLNVVFNSRRVIVVVDHVGAVEDILSDTSRLQYLEDYAGVTPRGEVD